MKTTAFVGHSDCSLHDTGWKHPDHQGRLPALVRAVYRDMLTLHDSLLEVEAVPADEEDLLLVHTPDYLRRVRERVDAAARSGASLSLDDEVMLSGASWRAALAATGAVLTGIGAVLRGQVRNSFCATRPPGHLAGPAATYGFSLFNHIAVGAASLRARGAAERVLIVEWSAQAGRGTAEIFRDSASVRVLSVHQQGTRGERWPQNITSVELPTGTGGELFRAAYEAAVDEVLRGFTPDFVLLSLGLDLLQGDPLGQLALDPLDLHPLTLHLRERADALCGGRLVSVLEGGYAPAVAGAASVQHLRALAGLPPA